jgi:hypothetical protein
MTTGSTKPRSILLIFAVVVFGITALISHSPINLLALGLLLWSASSLIREEKV